MPEVRAAFRKLALEHHPDRNRGPQDEKLFKTISAAYDRIASGQAREGAEPKAPVMTGTVGGEVVVDLGDIFFSTFFGEQGPFVKTTKWVWNQKKGRWESPA